MCADTGEIVGTHDGVQLYTVGELHATAVVRRYSPCGTDGGWRVISILS